MIKKLLLLMCAHILCAQNFAESSADSAVNSQDSADSANPPPPKKSKHYKTQNLKAHLSDI